MNYKELYEQLSEQTDALAGAYASQEFYGFFHTSCVYESAPALVSLHRTKKGAVKAMIAHQYAAWMDAQKEGRHLTRKDVRDGMKEYESFTTWTRKNKLWRKAYIHCKSHVAPVRVEE